MVLDSGDFWIEKPQNWNLRSNLVGTAVYIAKTSSDKKKPNFCLGGKSMFQKYVKIILSIYYGLIENKLTEIRL